MRIERLKDSDDLASWKPIFLIPDKGLETSNALPAGLAELAHANSFNGETGAILASADGVLFGVGDGSDPFILAAAAEKLPEGDYKLAAPTTPDIADQVALAWLLGGYKFDRYKKHKRASARLLVPRGADIVRVQRIYEAVSLVRDLVNTPASDMTPAALEDETRRIGARYGAEVETTVGEDLVARNFPMIHAVGRAASSAPRLIDMIWGREDAPKLTIVGKGVCFDTGGLDIKPSSAMLLMKKDMGGAATALAVAHMIMSERLDCRLRLLIASAENAISGDAFRPGDVLTSRSGRTIEIGNTDAEGRLVLADALTLADEEAPQAIYVFATLTGAARAALGPDLPAFFCDDDAFAERLVARSAAIGDPVWRMPLWEGYKRHLDSEVADMNNVWESPFAGAITAALFLRRFVQSAGRFAHFDLYGWRPAARALGPKGGEPQTARAVMDILRSEFAS